MILPRSTIQSASLFSIIPSPIGDQFVDPYSIIQPNDDSSFIIDLTDDMIIETHQIVESDSEFYDIDDSVVAVHKTIALT